MNLHLLVFILMLIIIFILLLKLFLIYQALKEITSGLCEKMQFDTNTLISTSSNNKAINHLANVLNTQLKELYKKRQTYHNSDRELKEAVTNISHDLRTPLTAICGYLDLLEKEELSENATRYLGFIQNRTQALKLLTEELFCYSVILSTTEDLHFETVNINNVLEENIASFYVSLTERGITPAIHIPEKKILRKLNKTALSRIFNNLLNNAIKYSDGDLEITLLDSGEIIFSNTTASLNEVQTARLFDRFFTVATARNSTGLGLAISKTLVEQMKGTIAAQYRDGKLCITVNFPEIQN